MPSPIAPPPAAHPHGQAVASSLAALNQVRADEGLPALALNATCSMIHPGYTEVGIAFHWDATSGWWATHVFR